MRSLTRSRLAAALIASCFLVMAGLHDARAVVAPPEGSILPDVDTRLSRGQRLAAGLVARAGQPTESLLAGPVVHPGELRQAAVVALQEEIADRVVVRWDPLTGQPRSLFARTGFLGKPDARPPVEVATDFLLRWRDLLGFEAEDVAALELTQRVPLPGGGTVVRFQQWLDGRLVEHGHVAVAVARDGRVLQLTAGRAIGGATAVRFTAQLSAPEALLDLARLAGIELAALPDPQQTTGDAATFSVAGTLTDVTVRQVVIATAWGPRLAWRARFDMDDGLAAYEVVLDDATRQPVRRRNLVQYLDTRGRVFAVNPLVSGYDLLRWPDADLYRTDESPLGWVATDLTEGNNATVRLDRNGDNEMTLEQQAQGAAPPPWLAFDFNFREEPTFDVDSGLTQLFWGISWSHDRFHRLGVDEPSGAYQVDNAGRGGLGNDPVLGDSQDGSGTNNANFSPSPDGLPGRMQMFLWNTSGTTRDSSFDVGVVIHEYAHGVSSRLVGGAHDAGCLGGGQGGSMGEGWSDYFAASWLDDTAVGAYVSGDPDGIRMFLLDENPPDGKDYRNYCRYPRDNAMAGFCEVHDNGEIWSGFLWLVREALVSVHGEDGAEIADRLIVSGMKLTPCQPSMLEARDGILLADREEYGGAHACLLRAAAADRWMGFSATSTGTNDVNPVTMNDEWPECLGIGSVVFTRDGLEVGQPVPLYSCDDSVVVSVTDGNAVAPVTVTVTSSGGDSETFDLSAGVDPAVFLGVLQTVVAAPTPDDGVLQVADGDTLTVTYLDLDVPGGVQASAAISCAARIEILDHRVTASTCDDDTVPNFPELPGFIDEGESADLVLTLANHMPVPVDGLVRWLVDRSDLITVLPEFTPVPISLPPARGDVPGTTTLTLRVAAVDDFMGATSAVLSLFLLADGYDAAVPYDLPLELNRDYELLAGLTWSDDFEGETDDPVGPEWTTGLLGAGTNEWSVVECQATSGTRSYRNGPSAPPDCAGDYSDDQGDPWLGSPVFDIAQPNTIAARIANLSFQHDVDMGAGGFGMFRFFDADAIVVAVTDDPTFLDPENAFGLADQALAVFADIPFAGLDSNTDGFEPQSVDILREQTDHVDLLQPFQFFWYFLPDITPSEWQGNPIEAQGEGYYFDDLTVTYELVNVVDQGAACVADVTPFAVPLITEPLAGVGCAAEPVAVDAQASEAVGCGGPLEYRFLVGGAPVACATDATGMTPRAQDPDGWGTGAVCYDFPTADTTYDVEVRCQAQPAPTDTRSVTVHVLHGTAIADIVPNAFCGSDPVVVNAGDSAVAGCPGGLEYRFLDSGGAELDCDGDGVPNGWSSSDTCDVDSPGGPTDVILLVRCADVPACDFATSASVPSLSITAAGREDDPTASPYCPGSPVRVTGEDSVVTGCAGGVPEYRWTAPGGTDTGWRTNPAVNLLLSDDVDVTLEVRCSTAITCIDTTTVPIDVVNGTYDLSDTSQPDDCVGDSVTLTAEEMAVFDPCPSGMLEYRFFRDGFPLACLNAARPDDGFWPEPTCETDRLGADASYRVDVRCVDDPSCSLSSTVFTIPAAMDGLPMGAPQGTLLVTKTGDCPADGDVLLDWPDTGRMPQAFVVIRSPDPTFPDPLSDHRLADVDGVAHADSTADCSPGTFPWVYYYQVVDRNGCTGLPIRDP